MAHSEPLFHQFGRPDQRARLVLGVAPFHLGHRVGHHAGGACGYLSFAGDMDVAIATRTGIVKDQVLYVQAAAGVVADSVPEMEWKETEAKARALMRAAELVEEGF